MTWTGFAQLLGLRPVATDTVCMCDQLCPAAGMGPQFCKRRYDDAYQDLIDFRDHALARGQKLAPLVLVPGRCDRRGLPIVRVRAAWRVRRDCPPDHA